MTEAQWKKIAPLLPQFPKRRKGGRPWIENRPVEQSFGWMKMVGMLRKVKLRGIEKVGWLFTFTGATYNLCRLRNLMAKA
jgi:hypothetical protein